MMWYGCSKGSAGTAGGAWPRPHLLEILRRRLVANRWGRQHSRQLQSQPAAAQLLVPRAVLLTKAPLDITLLPSRAALCCLIHCHAVLLVVQRASACVID